MRRTIAPTLISLIVLAGAVTLGGLSPAAADKGGCPNEAAANAVARANSKSAHGPDKQGPRGCSAVAPTPTPTPVDGADVWVEGVSITTPATAYVGVRFPVFVGVSLRNNGPADEVTADTTVHLAVPSGCSLSPSSPDSVTNSLLKKNLGVFISVGWYVTCSQPGIVTLNANATADPVSVSDPIPTNNTGSDSETTDVLSQA